MPLDNLQLIAIDTVRSNCKIDLGMYIFLNIHFEHLFRALFYLQFLTEFDLALLSPLFIMEITILKMDALSTTPNITHFIVIKLSSQFRLAMTLHIT